MNTLKKSISLFFIFLFISLISFAQNNIWNTLGEVEYEEKFNKELGMDIPTAVFSKNIFNLEGKKVIVKGYLLPLQEFQDEEYLVFSANPYSSCFFCGMAGPETVMEIYTNQIFSKTNRPIKISGRLRVNRNDYNHLMYQLLDAKIHYDE